MLIFLFLFEIIFPLNFFFNVTFCWLPLYSSLLVVTPFLLHILPIFANFVPIFTLFHPSLLKFKVFVWLSSLKVWLSYLCLVIWLVWGLFSSPQLILWVGWGKSWHSISSSCILCIDWFGQFYTIFIANIATYCMSAYSKLPFTRLLFVPAVQSVWITEAAKLRGKIFCLS